jgi:peptidoglycan/LPS O-acetylase OafA/YrhL
LKIAVDQLAVHSGPRASANGTVQRFYQPELDALRFFAFLAVLVHHGPNPYGVAGLVRSAGGFGVSVFFLLSAYLITALLVREREQFGTLSWGRFFIRRALRIWPLYYAAVAVGSLVLPALATYKLSIPNRFYVSQSGSAAMLVFIANWVPIAQLGMLAPLWSISVEEQFYLLWPPIIKFGGEKSALVASAFFVISAGIWLQFFSGRGWLLWSDTPVAFVFFAAGAIIALATRGAPLHIMNGVTRSGLAIAGLLALAVAARFGGITDGADSNLSPTILRFYVGYGAGVSGCVMIFLATLGLSNIPGALIYLGKMSYGLYVFHLGMLLLAWRLTEPLKLAPHPVVRMFIVDTIALLFCIVAAHLSYRYFEMPFLKLKERFEIIKSRPA